MSLILKAAGQIPMTPSISPYVQGSAQILYGSAPTGNTAVYFPGVTGSYLNFGTTHPAHFNTSTSNLFVESWVNFSQNAFTEYITGTLYSTTTDDWGFRCDGTFNRIMFYHYNTGGSSTAVTATTPLIQGTWYHVAASFATTGTNGSLTSGTADNIRFEITSPNTSTGTFNVVIRQGNDTTNKKVVLEIGRAHV